MNHQAAIDKVNDVLSALKIDPPHVSTVSLTPSQADLGWCERRLYYKLTQEPGRPRTTLTDVLRRSVGDAIHDIVQNWLKEQLPEVIVEFPTRERDLDGIMARGRIDLILPALSDGWDYLGEIKSCKDADYKKFMQTLPSSYRFQILMNAFLTDFWFPAVLILVNRNTMTVGARLIEVSKEAWEEEYAKVLAFRRKHVDGKIIPSIPSSKSSFLCGTLVPCQYYESCYGRARSRTGASAKASIFGRRSE